MCDTTKFNERGTITDFSKNAILNCYRAILDYLHDDEVESEECIAVLFDELEVNKICIPANIFAMIDEYVDEYISPIVYDPDNTFALSNHEEELLEIEQSSPNRTYSTEEIICFNFVMTLHEIEKDLDINANLNLSHCCYSNSVIYFNIILFGMFP